MKVLVVGSINESPFIKTDVLLLSEFSTVDTVNIIGGFGGGTLTKSIQVMKLFYLLLFIIPPKIRNNDLTYVWFADVHALFCIWCAKVFHKRTIVCIGGYEVCDMPEIGYGLQRKSVGLRGRISRMVLRDADVCIIPSQSYYERSLPYVDERRLFLYPTCTRLEYPTTIPPKKTIAVMVGSATPTTYLLKGIPLYNEIATRSDINCYLIGDYDTEISGRYPHITYLGKMGHEKVIQWLSSAKIYCQVSYTESYGVAVMEAMACGCIPVVSDKDNLGDSVKGNKFAVCSNDIEKILVGINTILACAKDSDCIDMINLTKMKIHYACAERKFGLAGLVRRYT